MPGARDVSPAVEAYEKATIRTGHEFVAPLLIFAGLFVVPLVARFGAESYVMSLATRIVLLALEAMSLQVLIGYCGLVSFGHAAFVGVGAYAVGFLMQAGLSDIVVQMSAAIAFAMVFALVSGTISLRTDGPYFIMITLAFAQMLFFFSTSVTSLGGDDGVSLLGRSSLFGSNILRSDKNFYYLSLGVLVIVFLGLQRVVASRFGRVLRGSRDNAQRMSSIGFSPWPYRLAAYVMAGVIAAIGGVLTANSTEFISPSVFSWQLSGDLIVVVVLGGGSLYGPIVGSLVYVLVQEGLSRTFEDWQIVFGPLVVLVVLFLRGGLSLQIQRFAARL